MKKEKKNRKTPRAVKIIVGILLAIIALIVIGLAVIWIISPELFTFIITFVIPNLPKLLTGNNMKAAWIMFTSDNAAIVEQIDTNQQNKSDTLGISAEVLAAIESGNYTEQEIARILDTKGEAIAEIDASKLAASEGMEENTEKADGIEDVLNQLSPEVLVAIESGKYTEEEITLIIETKGEALSAIDAEKAKQEQQDKQPQKEQESTPPESDKVPVPEKTPDVNTEIPSNDTQSGQSSEDVKPSQSKTPSEPAVENPTDTTAPTQPGKSEQVTPPESEAPDVSSPATPTVSTAEIINKHVAKLYIVKNRFVTELGSTEKTIRKQYVSLPKEQQVPTSRKEIAKQYISVVADLELECDAEVESILAALKTELSAVGGDLTIIDTIRLQYEEEKSLKKAYYLDIYMNGLPDKEPASGTESTKK